MTRRSDADLLGETNVVPLKSKLAIARGSGSNLGAITEVESVTWRQFCDELSTALVDREHSHAAFMSFERDQQDDLKSRAGWIAAGVFDGKRRNSKTVVSRSIISIDIDKATRSLMRKIERGDFEFEFFAHTTRKHTKEVPRIRIYGPLNDLIDASDYARAARAFAQMFVPDLEGVDTSCFESARLMFLPTVSRDQEYWWHKNSGARFIPPQPRREEIDESDDSDLSIIAHNQRFFADFDELADCVRAIKNDADIDRAAWRDILGAIAFESKGSDDGRDLALEFSENWTGGDHDQEKFDETWLWFAENQDRNSGNRKFKTGRHLLKLAMADGYRRPISGKYPLDQEGVCRAFEDAHKDQLRYDEDSGFWYVLKAGVWRPRSNRYAFHWARLASVDIAKAAPGSTAAKDLRKARTWGAVESAERRNPAFTVNQDYWNPNPFMLGTPAGVVNLKTGKMRDAESEDRITKLTRVSPIPLEEFDAERDCPRWLDFLDDVCGDDSDLVRLIQQYAGYSLTGDVSEHKLLFVYGAGRNGKGTLQNQLRLVMGDYAVVANMATFAESKYDRHLTELAALAGARLVAASETEEGRAWAEARLKACTGGDPITARFMRQDEFTYEPQFKLFFIGNHKPNLHNVDDAIKARVNIVPFDFKPEKIDTALNEKLKREWRAILSWMIEGCLDWRENGLIIPKVVKDANAEYFSEQDTLGRWIEDCCDLGRQHASTNGALFESYTAFAGLRGDIATGKSKSFPDEMMKRGFQRIKDECGIRGRGFRGIRLKTRRDHRFTD
ncbi:MAG: phage/plasmid primase, P4 family [Pseudomonadota bacterium]